MIPMLADINTFDAEALDSALAGLEGKKKRFKTFEEAVAALRAKIQKAMMKLQALARKKPAAAASIMAKADKLRESYAKAVEKLRAQYAKQDAKQDANEVQQDQMPRTGSGVWIRVPGSNPPRWIRTGGIKPAPQPGLNWPGGTPGFFDNQRRLREERAWLPPLMPRTKVRRIPYSASDFTFGDQPAAPPSAPPTPPIDFGFPDMPLADERYMGGEEPMNVDPAAHDPGGFDPGYFDYDSGPVEQSATDSFDAGGGEWGGYDSVAPYASDPAWDNFADPALSEGMNGLGFLKWVKRTLNRNKNTIGAVAPALAVAGPWGMAAGAALSAASSFAQGKQKAPQQQQQAAAQAAPSINWPLLLGVGVGALVLGKVLTK